MTAKCVTILEEIGLGKNEAKAYLALVEIGSATAGQIADKTKTHRATIYDALDKLLEKGIISFSFCSGVKYFQATEPENLMGILKQKEENLKGVIPELMLKLQLSDNKSEAHVSYGIKAIMDTLYGFLKFNEPILVYGIPKIAPEMLKTQIPHFHKKRIPLKIPMLSIYNHDATERIKIVSKWAYSECNFLPEKFDSQVSTNICGDEVCLFLFREEPIVIKIKDKVVAESYKRYFYLMWETCLDKNGGKIENGEKTSN
ncbi:MAG: helix-turn-helix domain-containing protein [Candidatus Woesearchaeota archaeon]